MNTSLPNWASADSLGTTLQIPAASPVSCRACGTVRGPGRGRQRGFSGPCELLAELRAEMSVQSDSLCALKKKKKRIADFKFTFGFKIYYVLRLSSLHT